MGKLRPPMHEEPATQLLLSGLGVLPASFLGSAHGSGGDYTSPVVPSGTFTVTETISYGTATVNLASVSTGESAMRYRLRVFGQGRC